MLSSTLKLPFEIFHFRFFRFPFSRFPIFPYHINRFPFFSFPFFPVSQFSISLFSDSLFSVSLFTEYRPTHRVLKRSVMSAQRVFCGPGPHSLVVPPVWRRRRWANRAYFRFYVEKEAPDSKNNGTLL